MNDNATHETELVEPETARSVGTLGAIGLGGHGIKLQTFDDVWQFSMCLVKSGLAPKGLDTPHACVIAIQLGLEVGLSPMAAIQNIAVINGRPTVWGDAMLAICKSQPVFDHAAFREVFSGAKDEYGCTVQVRRKPDGQPIVHTFTIADAKTAKLWGKAGPWSQFPKRMLQMRARSFALRDAFPDVLKGLYTAEEARDIPEAIDVQATPAPAAANLESTPAAAPPTKAERIEAALAPAAAEPERAAGELPEVFNEYTDALNAAKTEAEVRALFDKYVNQAGSALSVEEAEIGAELRDCRLEELAPAEQKTLI